MKNEILEFIMIGGLFVSFVVPLTALLVVSIKDYNKIKNRKTQ